VAAASGVLGLFKEYGVFFKSAASVRIFSDYNSAAVDGISNINLARQKSLNLVCRERWLILGCLGQFSEYSVCFESTASVCIIFDYDRAAVDELPKKYQK
jgi:hypothetical protein